MISVAGLPFHIEASVPLSDGEMRLISDLERLKIPAMTDRAFAMEVTSDPPWTPAAEQRSAWGTPAAISFADQSLRIAHDEVIGEFDLVSGRGSYARYSEFGGPLRIMLRVACTASLPFHGAIPLHSCAVVRQGEAYVFFGESGAGKTTMARVSRLPVISDEIVAVAASDGRLFARATGFGEELGSEPAATIPVRVAALVHLTKGERFHAVRLSRREAMPELLKVILTPPHPHAWTAALRVLGRIIESNVPIVRMRWSPERSPIDDLAAFLETTRSGV